MSVGTCDFLCPSQARSSNSSLLRAQLHPEPEERGTEHPQGCLRADMVTLLFLQSYCTEPLSLGVSSALAVPGALGAQSPRGLCCQPRAEAKQKLRCCTYPAVLELGKMFHGKHICKSPFGCKISPVLLNFLFRKTNLIAAEQIVA